MDRELHKKPLGQPIVLFDACAMRVQLRPVVAVRDIAGLGCQVRIAKVHGDVYEPISAKTSLHPHDPAFYKRPITGHQHESREAVRKDIALWKNGRHHKLLVGKPGKSFVWQTPRYQYRTLRTHE